MLVNEKDHTTMKDAESKRRDHKADKMSML